ncbi:MAG: hypothetical protein L0271_01450 [Gemmatimonadetes bacterium]|nr:hypothetical protein [Gemmatimonadota bacterium]
MSTRVCLAPAIGALLLAAPLVAQSDECELLPTPGSQATIYNEGSESQMMFIGGGARFRCPDGLRIQSDSVAYYGASSIVEFISRARYEDPDNRLTADYLRYMTKERQAIAQGNVVLTAIATGSVITGPYLIYYQKSDSRPEQLIQFQSGRPHAVLVRSARADSVPRDTTIVDAEAMDIEGSSLFRARGRVEITQGETRGWGMQADYQQDLGTLRLAGDARMLSEDYELQSDTIDAETDEKDDPSRLTGRGRARLVSTDATVDAPRIDILFVDGEVHRLVAVAARDSTRAETAGDSLSRQARAVSTDFRMTADSIDALLPARVIESVTAVGAAYGERLTAELADANVPAMAANDWMKGDTILATFVADTLAPPDSAGRHPRVLNRVTALSGIELATSSYRVVDEEQPDVVSINYVRARRIVVNLAEGSVSTVDAEGDVHGIYLQPLAKARPGGQTTASRRP